LNTLIRLVENAVDCASQISGLIVGWRYYAHEWQRTLSGADGADLPTGRFRPSFHPVASVQQVLCRRFPAVRINAAAPLSNKLRTNAGFARHPAHQIGYCIKAVRTARQHGVPTDLPKAFDVAA